MLLTWSCGASQLLEDGEARTRRTEIRIRDNKHSSLPVKRRGCGCAACHVTRVRRAAKPYGGNTISRKISKVLARATGVEPSWCHVHEFKGMNACDRMSCSRNVKASLCRMLCKEANPLEIVTNTCDNVFCSTSCTCFLFFPVLHSCCNLASSLHNKTRVQSLLCLSDFCFFQCSTPGLEPEPLRSPRPPRRRRGATEFFPCSFLSFILLQGFFGLILSLFSVLSPPNLGASGAWPGGALGRDPGRGPAEVGSRARVSTARLWHGFGSRLWGAVSFFLLGLFRWESFTHRPSGAELCASGRHTLINVIIFLLFKATRGRRVLLTFRLHLRLGSDCLAAGLGSITLPWQSMAEHGRAWQSMAEHGRAWLLRAPLRWHCCVAYSRLLAFLPSFVVLFERPET